MLNTDYLYHFTEWCPSFSGGEISMQEIFEFAGLGSEKSLKSLIFLNYLTNQSKKMVIAIRHCPR